MGGNAVTVIPVSIALEGLKTVEEASILSEVDDGVSSEVEMGDSGDFVSFRPHFSQ